MTNSSLQSLKADFLKWTGGFEPETEGDIAVYLDTSFPLDLPLDEARVELQKWMLESSSFEVSGHVDQH